LVAADETLGSRNPQPEFYQQLIVGLKAQIAFSPIQKEEPNIPDFEEWKKSVIDLEPRDWPLLLELKADANAVIEAIHSYNDKPKANKKKF